MRIGCEKYIVYIACTRSCNKWCKTIKKNIFTLLHYGSILKHIYCSLNTNRRQFNFKELMVLSTITTCFVTMKT